MTPAVAYLRVSTAGQAEEGVSLAAQEEKVRMYARLYDLELREVITDPGVSAKTLDRPGLVRALAMLDSGEAEALVVVKLDRLTRSVVDLGRLLDGYFGRPDGPALMVVQEQVDTRSASGRLVLNVLMSVAQWEREAIGERTSTALRHKASRGEFTGGRAPFGWEVGPCGVKLKPAETEQKAIAEAIRLRDEGMSLRAVGAELDLLGFNTRSGRPWQASGVKRLLAARQG